MYLKQKLKKQLRGKNNFIYTYDKIITEIKHLFFLPAS